MRVSFCKFLHSQTGPGGWRCPCCGPGPTHKKRVYRRIKKRFNRMIDKFHKD